MHEGRDGYTGLPRWEPGKGVVVDWMANETLRFVDPRVVEVLDTGLTRLTFVSHLAMFRCRDGRHIDAGGAVRFFPEESYETFGVEDPRITRLDGRYYFTYVAVSPHGAATALASTTDFERFERHGISLSVREQGCPAVFGTNRRLLCGRSSSESGDAFCAAGDVGVPVAGPDPLGAARSD